MRKFYLWMLAAILTLCGTMTTLTSCSEYDNPATDLSSLAEQIQGTWYAEYERAGVITPNNDLVKPFSYSKVMQVYRFDTDATGMWLKLYFNAEGESVWMEGDFIYATNLETENDGFFKYTTASDGTIRIDWPFDSDSNPGHSQRQLKYDGGKISVTDDEDAYTLALADDEMKSLINQHFASMHGGSDESYNINEDKGLAIDKFNQKTWRKNSSIYLYDGVSPYNGLLLRKGYTEVPLPWAEGLTQTNLPRNFCDDITPENGWELVMNLCGNNRIPNNNYFALYNKYTGTLRFFYYMPAKCGQGNDHFWQISMDGDLAYRTPLIYGIPADMTITDNAAPLLGLTGIQPSDELSAYVTPWSENDVYSNMVIPNMGWWAFDVNLSCYRPELDMSKGKILLRMHEFNESNITLCSEIAGNIDGSLEGNIDLKAQVKEGSKTAKVFTKIFQVGKAMMDVGTFLGGIAEGKPSIACNGLATMFGDLATITGQYAQDKVTGYKGTFDATLNLGLSATAATVGSLKAATPIGEVVTPTISIKDFFNLKDSHLGEGVWRLKKSPKIYMTNQRLRLNFKNEITPNNYGCVWFFDPSSVEIELNPNVFSNDIIDWIQVDAICAARPDMNQEEMDRLRQEFQLSPRLLSLSESDYSSDYYHIEGNSDGENVLVDFFYSESDKLNTTFPVLGTAWYNTDTYTSFEYYGRGEEGRYILEPQGFVTSRFFAKGHNCCIAPPVVVDVLIRVKLKGRDGVLCFNGNFLPEIGYVKSTNDDLTRFYNDIRQRTPDYVRNYKDHNDTYKYNVKRVYDKIMCLFPTY